MGVSEEFKFFTGMNVQCSSGEGGRFTDFVADNIGRVPKQLGPADTIDLAGVATSARRATWVG